MSLLTSGKYKDSYERVLAKGAKRCTIVNIRSIDGEEKDGQPPRDMDVFSMQLDEAAKTIDGDVVEPGFIKDAVFGSYPRTDGDAKRETTNRISGERIRELVISALRLPAACKDPHAEVEKQGGLSCLKGRQVVVEWSARDGRQNVDRFLAVPADK